MSDLQVGSTLGTATYHVTRADLVRYAGASGDFNVIHWNDRVATSVGLPGVIAHGMLTMALAGRFVGEWCGDPTAVVDYGVRFQRPVVVPDTDSGVEVTFGGEVLEIRADAVVVSVTAATADGPVLRDATATIRVVGGDMSRNGGATR